ncbi:YicC family protein [Treponema sp.]
MKSMTGFGYTEKADENYSISVELKSYNNRFLEIYVNLPPYLSPLESRIRDYISSRCQRGKVEVSIRAKELSGSLSVSIDEKAAAAYFDAIRGLAMKLGLEEKPKLSTLLSLDGVLQTEKSRDIEGFWKEIERALETAFAQFEASREREGEATEADIAKHIRILEASVAGIMTYVPILENTIKENLALRFKELLGDSIDENRILAETAVLLMKYSISEELARLSAHLIEFSSEMSSNAAPGKKLDFLC